MTFHLILAYSFKLLQFLWFVKETTKLNSPLFLASTSFIPRELISQIADNELVSFNTIRKRLFRNGLKGRLNELRDFFGSFMITTRFGYSKSKIYSVAEYQVRCLYDAIGAPVSKTFEKEH
jgi:hypothetical protein